MAYTSEHVVCGTQRIEELEAQVAALQAQIAAADALAEAVRDFNFGKHYTFGTVLKATDAYLASKEPTDG